MTRIVAGSSCKEIAQSLGKALSLECLEAQVERFADEELRIQIPCSLHKQDVVIVQSTSRPANDRLMELLLIIDAAKRAGSNRIIALIPYFGYSRQDRPSYQWGPISARLVTTMLEAAGIDHVITLDLHSKQLEGFFKVGVQNIDPAPLFASMLNDEQDIAVVSPDIGGLSRAKNLAELIDAEIVITNKTRKSHNECYMDNVIGEVSGKNCVIVDDIVDTGNTLCKAAELLISEGAASIQVFITHGVLSGNAIENLQNSAIEKITITGSIPQPELPSKFFIADAIPLLEKALQRVL